MNRVWIELEIQDSDEKNHSVAKLASNMIRRLCPDAENSKRDTFWFCQDNQQFCVVIDQAGGFQRLNDNGHWFNLDHLGREA